MDAGREACDDGNGREGDGCNSDCRISGERVWCLDDFGPPGGAVVPTALAVGPSGDVAVVGTTREAGTFGAWLQVVDASGSPRWSAGFDDAAGRGVAFLPDGGIAVAIYDVEAAGSRVASFLPDGALRSGWADVPPRIASRGLVAGPSGTLVVAGDTGSVGGTEAWFGTLSADLVPREVASYRSPSGLELEARGLAVDRSGTVILGAEVLLEPFESDSGVPLWGVAVVAMYPSGEVVWEHVFEPSHGRAFLLSSLAALSDGSVVATGALQTGPISSLVWTASVSKSGVRWESVDEGVSGYGASVTATDSDFFRTLGPGLDVPPAPATLFGRYDARGGTLWEREHSIPGRRSVAGHSAWSPTDLSVLIAGSSAPVPAREPVRPWLCKRAE